MNGKKRLGRGLEALITIEEEIEDSIKDIKINDIEPNKDQPRKIFDDSKLNELAESIKKHGIVQPIIVKKEDGSYIVEGAFIERLLSSTYFDDVDSLRYFQDMLRKKGVIDELKELGIQEYESVFICGYEFEFFD